MQDAPRWYKSGDTAICADAISKPDAEFFDTMNNRQAELGYTSTHYEAGLIDSLTGMGGRYTLQFEDEATRDEAFIILTVPGQNK